MGSHAMLIKITAGFSESSIEAENRECHNMLRVILNADLKGACSKQYSTSVWAAQPSQKAG